MRITLRNAVAFTALIAAVYLSAVPQGPHTDDLSNSPRPAADFSLPDLSGRPVRLSEYKGQVVLVDFWATWCLPCLEELPELKALYGEHKDGGFVIVGISMDEAGQEALARFVREYQVPYPILHAGLDEVEGFPVRGLPTAYLVDRRGFIIKKYFGFKDPEELERDVAAALKRGES